MAAKAKTATVRMLVRIGGTRNGQEWPAVGETVTLPDHEAQDLINSGHAEPA